MKDAKALLIGVLSETLKIDESGVTSLFNEDGTAKDDAEQTILGWHAEHIKKVKESQKKLDHDEGYGKAQREILTKFENDFKTKTGFKSDKKGVELVLDYANSVQPKEGAITDDVIKKHPLYLTLQEEKENAVKEAVATGETALNQFKTELSKKETFGKVSNKALEIFNALKPILPTDPNRRKAQEELFIERLQGFEYELQDDRIVISKDGKIYEDAHGGRITLDKLVKDTANKYYEFQAADPKQNAGNGKDGKKAEPLNVVVPKTEEEYTKALFDTSKTVEERNAIKDAWAKTKATS